MWPLQSPGVSRQPGGRPTELSVDHGHADVEHRGTLYAGRGTKRHQRPGRAAPTAELHVPQGLEGHTSRAPQAGGAPNITQGLQQLEPRGPPNK